MKVQVCIIGGGPSGLLLSQLLHLQGIDTVVLEKYSRDHVLARIRAGVLEHGFAKLMREAQCGERMDREGEIHHGFHIAHDGRVDRVDLVKYSGGNSVMVYGQTEVTRDLMDARRTAGLTTVYGAQDVAVHDFDGSRPRLTQTFCERLQKERMRVERLDWFEAYATRQRLGRRVEIFLDAQRGELRRQRNRDDA